MTTIRPYRAGDLPDLYRICLQTGDAGQDATHLFRDPDIIGHVYAGPYGVLSPQTAFVVADADGVGGYVIGPPDTYAFEGRCEAEWWPPLRARYACPTGDPAAWSHDARMAHRIHHPLRMPRRINEAYPAHLHIDLLPRFQGRGIGRRMIDRWIGAVRSAGACGACLGVGARNRRAVAFYRAYGFHEVERFGEDIVFGLAFAGPERL